MQNNTNSLHIPSIYSDVVITYKALVELAFVYYTMYIIDGNCGASPTLIFVDYSTGTQVAAPGCQCS
jgi:hypothetical protein